ncbi:diguanylate cyclase domain-containing protein [Dechloromonas sp.]|uniref:diguanylate cyclase domain-containing protein n=1 Tax=Dechloromonas sp. TaxID=1917218 RepID=UPI00286E09DB|nr:diguanylate cyclase [Dechloromonas sp.]
MRVFEKIFEAVPDGLLVVDTAGLILYANGALESLFGYAPDELIGQPVERLTPHQLASAHVAYREHYQTAPKTRAMGASNDLLGCRKDGSLFPVDVMLSPLDIGDRKQTLCVVRDATVRKEIEEKLTIANTVFQSTQEGIVVTDVNCRIIAVNPAFEMATEYSKKELLGQHMRVLRSGRHDDFFYRRMWDSILNTGEWQGPIWNRRKNGEVYHEWLSISTVRDRDGRPIQYVGITTDMGRMNHVETAVERLAHYDALTGLPNRLLLNSRIQKTWERAHRDGKPFAVMFLDLDGFKAVNDTLGHPVGDELLKVVATRLRENMRETDTIARLGGDEFLIVLEDVMRDDIVALAQQLIERISAPFDLGLAEPVCVGLSLGWSHYPEHADNVPALIRQADEALYQVKRSGRGAWREYCG